MTALSVTALRLAAIEALAPTAAIAAGSGFPTIAGSHVYDTRSVPVDALAPDAPPALTIGVYAEETEGVRRGDGSASHNEFLSVDLTFELELAVIDSFDGEPGVGNPATDAAAAVQLEFLASQIRYVLLVSQAGYPFRRICKAVSRTRTVPFRLPELAVRLARLTMVMACEIDDDEWSDAPGELPEPLAGFAAGLPDGSYARDVCDQIAAAWPGQETPPQLQEIRFGLGAERPDTFDDAPLRGRVDLTGDP
ncbi:hypothetical protein [Afifella aestuarii]|uniref:hypothetical protein n=1 Tax=Afifella aestuarii TaxID=1909496 RepID=UPI000FE32211|nr:hypothetical protein [Afifella aestuarii]